MPLKENPIQNIYLLNQILGICFLPLVISYIFFWFSNFPLVAYLIVLLIFLLLCFASYFIKNSFYFRFDDSDLVIKQFGRSSFQIPYNSITRIYIYQPSLTINKLFGLKDLIVEFSNKNHISKQLLHGGPRNALSYSPGVWGDYFSIPALSEEDISNLVSRLLEKCKPSVPEIINTGLLLT